MSWLKQALTREDNRTYDGAYLALAAVIAMVGFTITALMVLAFIDMLSNVDNNFSYGGLGGGIAAIIGALGAFIGSVGGYILLERKGVAVTEAGPLATKTTTESQSSVTKTTTPAPPPPADLSPAKSGPSIQALSPEIKQANVGGRIAIVTPKPKRKRSKPKG
ncbi:MAG TPA: hypothetical protein VF014_04125 [Casimicrobiaceae bacterium]|nr:hypothetical protein [Casimicrobiaceae bacterium]